jgi:hypothetical protein
MSGSVLRESYVFNPTDNWITVKVVTDTDIFRIPVIPPHSSRDFPAHFQAPRLGEERALLPHEVKRFAPEVVVAPVIVEPIDVTLEAVWVGTFTIDGTKHSVSIPISIESDKFFGGTLLPTQSHLLLTGRINPSTHTVDLTCVTAPATVENPIVAVFAAARIKRDGGTLTLSGENPPTKMSFMLTVDQAHPPAIAPSAAAEHLTGTFFGMFARNNTQIEWEGAVLAGHPSGLLHGTARENGTQVVIQGICNPLFFVTRKGTDAQLGIVAGTVTVEAGSSFVEGVWRPPGADGTGAVNLFRCA